MTKLRPVTVASPTPWFNRVFPQCLSRKFAYICCYVHFGPPAHNPGLRSSWASAYQAADVTYASRSNPAMHSSVTARPVGTWYPSYQAQATLLPPPPSNMAISSAPSECGGTVYLHIMKETVMGPATEYLLQVFAKCFLEHWAKQTESTVLTRIKGDVFSFKYCFCDSLWGTLSTNNMGEMQSVHKTLVGKHERWSWLGRS
jgi:hypothetical protein